MIVGETMYDRWPRVIDGLNDVDFFDAAICAAKANLDPSVTKESSPVVFASTLSKQQPDERAHVARKVAHSDRVRRKFVMLDVDYDPGEEQLASELRSRAIEFADKHGTHLLIYPTISWPVKPRFRIVVFCSRVLNARSYMQAVKWLAGELEYAITDMSDMSIRVNRNLPSFNDQSQVDAIYSTLRDDTRKPLDNSLWRDVHVDKPKRDDDEDELFDENVRFDEDILVWAASVLAQEPRMQRRGSFWRLCRAVAAATYSSQISRDCANRVMDTVAQAAPNTAKREEWKANNRVMLDEEMSKMDDDEYFKGSPSLHAWPALATALTQDDENEKE